MLILDKTLGEYTIPRYILYIFLSNKKITLFLYIYRQCFDLLNKRFIFIPQVNFREQFMREFIHAECSKIWAQLLALDSNPNKSAENYRV
jgi:hypothetical protein